MTVTEATVGAVASARRRRPWLLIQLGGLYGLWLREVKRATRDRGQLIGGLSRPILWVLILGIGLNPYFRGEVYGEFSDWTPINLFLQWINENNPLRQGTADANDPAMWLKLHREVKATRMWRFIVLTFEALTVVIGGPILYATAPWWSLALVAGAVVGFLAHLGRPDDRPIITPATVAGRFRRVAQSKQRQKASHGLDDVVGVEPGGDIGRLLPNELAQKVGEPLDPRLGLGYSPMEGSIY